MSGQIFRTVRQAEPFREMGKFVGMTVLAGGALYVVNEPVAAFFYSRQVAQQETRRRQEAAAKEHQQELQRERAENARQLQMADEYLRQLEEKIYTGENAVVEIAGDSIKSINSSIGSGTAVGSKSSRLIRSTSITDIVNDKSATDSTSSERRPSKTQQPLPASLEPPNPIVSIAAKESQQNDSKDTIALKSQALLQESTQPALVSIDDNTATTTRKVVVDVEKIPKPEPDTQSKTRVYNWKSASRRMIEERKGLF